LLLPCKDYFHRAVSGTPLKGTSNVSEPFLAEIRIVGFNFAPRGWTLCDGQILPINQNWSLYSLLGTTYGGDGRTSFGLPDLRGRTPIHVGNSYPLGTSGGEETHTLNDNEMPQHTHSLRASSQDGALHTPQNAYWAATSTRSAFSNGVPDTTMASANVIAMGDGQAHNNMQPYLALNFIIALQGLFPSRN
jgi:microcystin-dependent protein